MSTASSRSSSPTAKDAAGAIMSVQLILMLVIGIELHYGETPTQALHTVSTLVHRSYYSLHQLWIHWRDEQEVYVVDTAGRVGGAPTTSIISAM